MEKVETEEYVGSSKFDKLRRISVIKPVSDKMGLKEGDEVSFYLRGSEFIIRKRVLQDINQDMIIQDVLNELKYNMKISFSNTGEPIITNDLSEYYDSSKIHLLDEEHHRKLLNAIGDEIAKKVCENVKKSIKRNTNVEDSTR